MSAPSSLPHWRKVDSSKTLVQIFYFTLLVSCNQRLLSSRAQWRETCRATFVQVLNMF